METLKNLYDFFNAHVTWDFGPEFNAKLSQIWVAIGKIFQ